MSSTGDEQGRDRRDGEPQGWPAGGGRPEDGPRPTTGGSSPADRPGRDYPYGPPAPTAPPSSGPGWPAPWPTGVPPAWPAEPPRYGGYETSGPPPAYGPPPGHHGPPVYGPPPGQGGPPAWGPGRYDGGVDLAAETPRTPTSTIVLLVVSAVCFLSGVLALAGVPALIIAAVAAARVRTDPQRAVELTRIGWWVLGGVLAACLLLLVLLVVVLVAGTTAGSYALLP